MLVLVTPAGVVKAAGGGWRWVRAQHTHRRVRRVCLPGCGHAACALGTVASPGQLLRSPGDQEPCSASRGAAGLPGDPQFCPVVRRGPEGKRTCGQRGEPARVQRGLGVSAVGSLSRARAGEHQGRRGKGWAWAPGAWPALSAPGRRDSTGRARAPGSPASHGETDAGLGSRPRGPRSGPEGCAPRGAERARGWQAAGRPSARRPRAAALSGHLSPPGSVTGRGRAAPQSRDALASPEETRRLGEGRGRGTGTGTLIDRH